MKKRKQNAKFLKNENVQNEIRFPTTSITF